MSRPAIDAGEILIDELTELGITPTELSPQINVPPNRVRQTIYMGAVELPATPPFDLGIGSARARSSGSTCKAPMTSALTASAALAEPATVAGKREAAKVAESCRGSFLATFS